MDEQRRPAGLDALEHLGAPGQPRAGGECGGGEADPDRAAVQQAVHVGRAGIGAAECHGAPGPERRPQGQRVWALGIVRRMRRLTADRAEIGLQIVANSLSTIDLVEQRKPQAADYSVDGEATTINGRIFHGLFLSLRKREGDPAVQSLIMPAAEYQPARRFKLQSPRSTNAIRLGHLLEQQSEWVWTAIEPLEHHRSTGSDTKRH